LDASDWLAVQAARLLYALPYYQADSTIKNQNAAIHFTSCRTHAKSRTARFQATYQPNSPVFHAQAGSLDHWLTERYCFYVMDHAQRLCRCDVHHLPWSLQHVQADIVENTMSEFPLPAIQPLLHYSDALDIITWPLVPVATSEKVGSHR
jgi:hypothetical protein